MIVSTKKALINTNTVLKVMKITLLHNYCYEKSQSQRGQMKYCV